MNPKYIANKLKAATEAELIEIFENIPYQVMIDIYKLLNNRINTGEW